MDNRPVVAAHSHGLFLLILPGAVRLYLVSMVESPRERHGVPALALSMISTAVVLTQLLSSSCTQRRPVEPDYPVIEAGPTLVAFTAIAGGATPPYQRVVVDNAGGGTLTFTATRKTSWLQIFYRGTAPDTIEVFAYAIGLRSGIHCDTITIRSEEANNSPVRIPVTLDVLPGISVSPGLIVRSAYRQGPGVAPETLEVTSEGGGSRIYQVAPTPDWLEIGYPVGLATQKIVVNFHPETVPAGVYGHELVISSAEAANLFVRALCSLEVEAWRPRFGLAHFVLTGIRFTSQQIGWAAGYERVFEGIEAALLSTEDGGLSWRTVSIPHLGALSALAVVNGDRLWMPSDTGILLTAVAGGFQFRALATQERLTDITFPCNDTGWVTGENGALFRSLDSGETWVQQTTNTEQSLNGIAFLDSRTGWAVGNKGTVIATSDGGDTWQAAVPGPVADLWDVTVSPIGTVWIVGSGGTILYRAWSGVKWTAVPSGVTDNLREIAFSTADIGWIVGSGGTILQTVDAGMTWRRQVSGTDQSLISVFPLDSARVFVAGNDALILDTYSGGE